jgi:hypothetical protein
MMLSEQGLNWLQCSSVEPIKSIIDYNFYRMVIAAIFYHIGRQNCIFFDSGHLPPKWAIVNGSSCCTDFRVSAWVHISMDREYSRVASSGTEIRWVLKNDFIYSVKNYLTENADPWVGKQNGRVRRLIHTCQRKGREAKLFNIRQILLMIN